MAYSFETARCPGCGGAPRGTLEKIDGVAEFHEIGRGDGTFLYEHSGYTDVDWETSTTETEGTEQNPALVLVCNDCGEEWPSFYTEVNG